LTPAELRLVLDADLDRREGEARLRRAEIHALASLVTLGVNAPKKLPKARAFIEGGARARFSTDAEISAYFRALAPKKG